MKITLVSHASLLVETNGVTILTDPWYEGTIYNNAWELCPYPPRRPDYRTLDAVFISHAHPDHYEPRTLAHILKERGPDIPIFIAMFFNDTIYRDLRAMGFRRVTEMVPGKEFSPFPRVKFFSQQFRLDDSLLVIKGEGDETLVNINDTPLRGTVLYDLAKRYQPEYVTAQFAIAQGYPYCYETAAPDFSRDDLIKRFDSFVHVLKPKHMIPFASFVRFCNADNAHMNAHKTSLSELVEKSTATLTILHPGDWIERSLVHTDPANAEHFERAQHSTTVVSEQRDINQIELDQAMQDFTERLSRQAPGFLVRKLPEFAFLVNGTDFGYRVTRGKAVRASRQVLEQLPIQYRLAAEVLYDSVRHDWGWADLSIGARFWARVRPGWEGREIWFWIIPMLAGDGYLALWTGWFLKPRSLRIWWGRRLEILDYVRSLFTGKFMSQVVRKKTTALAQ